LYYWEGIDWSRRHSPSARRPCWCRARRSLPVTSRTTATWRRTSVSSWSSPRHRGWGSLWVPNWRTELRQLTAGR